MQFVAWEKMVKIFFLKNFITFFWEVIIFIHRFHRVLDSLFSFLSNLFLSSSLVVHVRNVIDSPYSYWSFLLSHLGVYTKKNDWGIKQYQEIRSSVIKKDLHLQRGERSERSELPLLKAIFGWPGAKLLYGFTLLVFFNRCIGLQLGCFMVNVLKKMK